MMWAPQVQPLAKQAVQSLKSLAKSDTQIFKAYHKTPYSTEDLQRRYVSPLMSFFLTIWVQDCVPDPSLNEAEEATTFMSD